jgi:NTE family protein
VAQKRRQDQQDRQAIKREIGEQGAPPQDSAPDAATPAKARTASAATRGRPPLEHCAADEPAHDGPAHEAYAIRALVLQGGGALGSYQAGVYQGLAEGGIHPNWIAGISIGALNAAVIAGNPPETRVAQLRAFWEYICAQPWLPGLPLDLLTEAAPLWPEPIRVWFDGLNAARALVEGQRGFFTPRGIADLWARGEDPGRASYYDTAPLKATLERFVDFDRINRPKEMRVSVGAVNVRTGNFAYFDNTRMTLRAEHFMASGALPPGFPAVEIDGEYYWDGGLVSNTPLQEVLTAQPRRDALIFQVDLWSARGKLPHNLLDVAERQKDIQYSSRTRAITDYMREQQNYRRMLSEVMALVPPSKRDDPWYRRAADHACDARRNVIQLIYRDKTFEGSAKDYQFGVLTMHEHWSSGLDDIRDTLKHPHWLAMPGAERPFVTHDVHRGNGDT